MTITQPSTGDAVSGTIDARGDYRLRSAREAYDGNITGNTSTARYSYTTAAGCTETYDASFVIDPGPPANPLDRIAARVTCGPRSAASRRLAAPGQRCTLKTTNTGRRALRGVSIALPNTTVSGVKASNGGACTSEGGLGICTWAVAFRPKQSRTVNLTTARLIKVGTGVLICVSGNTDFAGSYCVDAEVKATSADLELELFAGLERGQTATFLNVRVVITNHGPDTSPSGVIRIGSKALTPFFFDWTRSKVQGCTAVRDLWKCQIRELARGESTSSTLTGDVDVDTLTVIGTVKGVLADPKPANNRDSARART